MTYATIHTLDGDSYTLTDEDVLWAARMIAGEGGVVESAPVLWTTTQRWMLFRKRGTSLRSFAAMILAFSQPINPTWRRDGSWCKQPDGRHWVGIKTGTNSTYHQLETNRCPCSESALAARDRYMVMPLENLDADKRAVLAAWASGRLENPVPRATNFAATRFYNPDPARIVLRAGNTYAMDDGSDRWPADYVWMGDTPPSNKWLWLALAAGSLGLWWWYRTRR